MQKERIDWIDVLKFLGIFEIYLGHFATAAGAAYSFVFTHHVPLFFFVSGCMETFNRETGVWANIRKKAVSLLIPFYVFSFISIVLHVLITDCGLMGLAPLVWGVIKGAIRDNFFVSSLWFLTCLFCVSTMFLWIKKLKYKSLILLAAVLLRIGGECIAIFEPWGRGLAAWPYNLDSAIYYCVYYALGYVCFPALKELLSDLNARKRVLLAVTGFAAFLYSAFLFFGMDLFSLLPATRLTRGVVELFRPLIPIWMLIIAAYLLRRVRPLAAMGSNTLLLCGSEYLVKEMFPLIAGMLGLGVTLATPFTAYAYTAILLVIANYALVPWEKRLLGCVTDGLTRKKPAAS